MTLSATVITETLEAPGVTLRIVTRTAAGNPSGGSARFADGYACEWIVGQGRLALYNGRGVLMQNAKRAALVQSALDAPPPPAVSDEIPAVSALVLANRSAVFQATVAAAVAANGASQSEIDAARSAVRLMLDRLGRAVDAVNAGNLRDLCTILDMAGENAQEVGSLNRGYVPEKTKNVAARIAAV